MNISHLLISAFQPLKLNENDHPEFFKMWKTKSVKKGEVITSNHEVERSFYVVIKGTQCIYVINRSGEKQVIGFSFDGSFSGIYDSFLHQKKSTYTLEALTNSEMLYISFNDYQRLFSLYPEFEYWGRIAHQELLIGRVNREIELITLSAKERFIKFEKRCPTPLKQIPQKYIASYLNMTPETYSRLRKECL